MKKSIYLLLVVVFLMGTVFTGWRQQKKRNRIAARNQPSDLTVMGIVNMSDGLGRLSVEVIKGLKDHISVTYSPSRKMKHAVNLTDVPDEIKKIIKKPTHRLGSILLYQDLLFEAEQRSASPKMFRTPSSPDEIRIAYSMFETTKIPDDWAMVLNLFFDAVAVPDPCLIDIYRRSGVEIPIFELPLALDLSMYLNEPLKKNRGSPMVFGSLGACIDRKNFIHLVRAFARAFGNDEKVQLRINSRYSSKETKEEIKREIENLGATNIFFSELRLESRAYLKLFQRIDCYVALSKGEGFSIQPREAMALGIPVILSDCMAHKTICETGLVERVPAGLIEPTRYEENFCGYSFNCDLDEAAEALRRVYNQYDHYLQRGEEARNWAKSYSHEALRPLYLTLAKPNKLILGDENKITSGYLMTTSRELYEKYGRLKWVEERIDRTIDCVSGKTSS